MTLALPARRRPRAAPLARAARALWVALTPEERAQVTEHPGHPDPWHAALARLDAAFGQRGAWLAATPAELEARLEGRTATRAPRGAARRREGEPGASGATPREAAGPPPGGGIARSAPPRSACRECPTTPEA